MHFHAEPAAVLGWTGQTCFFGRFFVQWLASERSGRCVVPAAFWWLSLSGAVLVAAFSSLNGDLVFLPGFAVGAFVAARNLRLAAGGSAVRPGALAAVGTAMACLLVASVVLEASGRGGDRSWWLAVAAVGQLVWMARFVVQWVVSERAGASRMPPAFWWTSLAGNVLLLGYALHLRQPVYVAGFLPGPLMQVRNLVLARRARDTAAPGTID